MIAWRLALAVVLPAATVAGCIIYLLAPFPRVGADQRPPLRPPKLALSAPETEASAGIAARLDAKEKDVATFEQAAKAILGSAADAMASADEQPITGPIPLPRRRPIPR